MEKHYFCSIINHIIFYFYAKENLTYFAYDTHGSFEHERHKVAP